MLIEIGHEKLRYLAGHAMAADATGKTIHLDLSDIFIHAAEHLTGTAVDQWG